MPAKVDEGERTVRNQLLVKAAYTLFAGLFVGLLVAAPAAAGPNDIHLPGLVKREPGAATGTVRNQEFRLLVHELGLVATPSPLQPAETTGQSGFDFGVDYAIHDISQNEPYWADAVEGKLEGRTLMPILQTIGVRGRKGFPLPVPLTSEVELGAQWITDSSMVNLGGNVRLALNEGFRWIPDIAVMAGINRLIGTDDLDLFTVSVGGTVSKSFGIGGTFNLAPYVGYQSVFVHAFTRIIDPDPTNVEDVRNHVVFQEVSMMDPQNRIDRVSAGLRFQVAVVQITAGVDVNVMPELNGDRRVFMQYAARAGLYF